MIFWKWKLYYATPLLKLLCALRMRPRALTVTTTAPSAPQSSLMSFSLSPLHLGHIGFLSAARTLGTLSCLSISSQVFFCSLPPSVISRNKAQEDQWEKPVINLSMTSEFQSPYPLLLMMIQIAVLLPPTGFSHLSWVHVDIPLEFSRGSEFPCFSHIVHSIWKSTLRDSLMETPEITGSLKEKLP